MISLISIIISCKYSYAFNFGQFFQKAIGQVTNAVGGQRGGNGLQGLLGGNGIQGLLGGNGIQGLLGGNGGQLLNRVVTRRPHRAQRPAPANIPHVRRPPPPRAVPQSHNGSKENTQANSKEYKKKDIKRPSYPTNHAMIPLD